ncbi:MAG: hypothetical protein WC312_03800 [Candidatus Omnitrophota bacterium]|jgi:hypothetical protein
MPEIIDYLYQFHDKGGHQVTFFIISRESGATSYYQYMSNDGYWYMMKEVRTDNIVVTTYTRPVSIETMTAALGWTGRADLTYNTPDEVFGEE